MEKWFEKLAPEGGAASVACMAALGLAYLYSPRVVVLCLAALCGTCHFSKVAPAHTQKVEEWVLALDQISQVALAAVLLMVLVHPSLSDYPRWWCHVTIFVLCATLTILTQDLSSRLKTLVPAQLVSALGENEQRAQYAMATVVALLALVVGLPVTSYFQMQYLLLVVIFTAGAASRLNGVQGVVADASSMVLPPFPGGSVETRLAELERTIAEMKPKTPQDTPSAPAA